MGTKKPAAYGGTCKVCGGEYKTNEEVYMQKNGEKWLICKDLECFTGQGGAVDAPKQGGGKFTSSKFHLSEATKIFNMAVELTESYKKQHKDLSPEIEAQFMESMFKTLAGSFKE